MRTEARKSLILLAGTGTTALLSVLYVRYVGRALGPAPLADFAGALSFTAICSVATGLINPTVARFTAEYCGRGEWGKVPNLAREVAKRVALAGILGLAVGMIAIQPLADFLQFRTIWPLLIALGIAYLNLPLAVVRGVMRGAQRFNQLNINAVAEAGLRLIFGIALLQFAVNAATGVLAYFLSIGVVLLVSPRQIRPIWQGYAPQQLDGDAIRRYTLPILLMTLTTAGFQNLDMLFVKRLFAEGDAGLYASAAALARVIAVLVTPFTTLMLPMLTTLHEQGRSTTVSFLRVCAYFLILVAVPTAAFCIWPETIITKFYDDRFAGAGTVLSYLVLARLLSYLNHMIGLYFAARSRFAFLYVYIPGMLAMIAGLLIWRDAPETTARVVLAAEGLTLAGMVVYFLARRQTIAE